MGQKLAAIGELNSFWLFKELAEAVPTDLGYEGNQILYAKSSTFCASTLSLFWYLFEMLNKQEKVQFMAIFIFLSHYKLFLCL